MKNVAFCLPLFVGVLTVLLVTIYIVMTPLGVPKDAEAHNSSVHDLTLTCPETVTEGDGYRITLTMDDEIIVRGVEGSWHFRDVPGHTHLATRVSTTASEADRATADLLYWQGGLNEVTSPEEHRNKRIVKNFNTQEDSITEHPERFRLYFENDASDGHGGDRLDVFCDIIILDDDPPEVSTVRMGNTPSVLNAYQVNDKIHFDVEFDEEVKVVPQLVSDSLAFPTLKFTIDGAGDDSPQSREAEFEGAYNWSAGAEDTRTLVRGDKGLKGHVIRFEYKVELGDHDADGLSISAHAATGLGEDMIGWAPYVIHKAVHSFDAQVDLPDQKIDGRFRPVDFTVLRPSVNPETALRNEIWSSPSNGKYYRPGETIRITYYFNDDFTVVGDEEEVSVDILMGYDGAGSRQEFERKTGKGIWRQHQAET